jgi:hypothetical protein
MIQTPSGNTSVRPKAGRYFRRHLRMEHAARLEASGQFSNNEIARLLNVTIGTLHQIKAQPEYLAKRAELATGVVCDLDSGLRQDAENLRREIQDMLPSALRTLRNAVQRGAVDNAPIQDVKVGMDAAKEIMDREGTFSKVSKSEIKIKEAPNLAMHEQTEVDLLKLLQDAQRQRELEEQDADGQKQLVKKTEQTITLEEFVSAAGDKDAQERMKNFIKLEDFDTDIRQ